MVEQSGFIDPHGGFRKLESYQIAEIVYDATAAFCNRLIERRSRTHDFLYSEATGLPISSYSEAEVGDRSESVFRHVYWAYPTLPSPYYGAQA